MSIALSSDDLEHAAFGSLALAQPSLLTCLAEQKPKSGWPAHWSLVSPNRIAGDQILGPEVDTNPALATQPLRDPWCHQQSCHSACQMAVRWNKACAQSPILSDPPLI